MRDFDKIKETNKGSSLKIVLMICIFIFLIVSVISGVVIYLSNQYYFLSGLSGDSQSTTAKLGEKKDVEKKILSKKSKTDKKLTNRKQLPQKKPADNKKVVANKDVSTANHKTRKGDGIFNLKLYLFDEKLDEDVDNIIIPETDTAKLANANIKPSIKKTEKIAEDRTPNMPDQKAKKEVNEKAALPTKSSNIATEGHEDKDSYYVIQLISYASASRAVEVAAFYRQHYSDIYIEPPTAKDEKKFYKIRCCVSKTEKDVNLKLSDMKKRFKKISPIKIKINKE